MRHEKRERWRKNGGRLLRVFTPFTLLLIGLITLNCRIDDAAIMQQSTVQPTKIIALSTQIANSTATPLDNHQSPISTAIANAIEPPTISPEATPKSESTLVPGEVAGLTGPPAGSLFSLSSALAFYWHPTNLRPEEQSFALFLVGDVGEKLLAVASEPNLGTGYQVHLTPENIDLPAGEYYWEVRLLQQQGVSVLGRSEQRAISLVESEQ